MNDQLKEFLANQLPNTPTQELEVFIEKALGDGSRFAKLVEKLKAEGHDEESAKAIAAAAGRAKWGKSRFQKMAQKGRKK